MWWIVGGAVLLAAALWGPVVSSRVEQPAYRVVETEGRIELRDYGPMIVATATVTGERAQAINEGFRLIADYIFGNNIAASRIPMTAPVTQQRSAKIAMTAPVIQQRAGEAWQVQFVMPSRYTLDTLPTPRNPAVTLRPIGPRRFAVIRFAGLTGPDNLERHTEALQAFLRKKALKPLGEPTYAFYNPPWTLPPLRRNEVMIEVARTLP